MMEVSPALFPDHLRASLASCDVATSQTLVAIDACLKRLSDLDNVLKPVTSAISPVLGRTPSGPLLTGPQDIPKHLATIRAHRTSIGKGPAAGEAFLASLQAVHVAASSLRAALDSGAPGLSASEVKAAAALRQEGLTAARAGLAAAFRTGGSGAEAAALVQALVRAGDEQGPSTLYAEARRGPVAAGLEAAGKAEAGPPGQRVAATLRALGEIAQEESQNASDTLGAAGACQALSALVGPLIVGVKGQVRDLLGVQASLSKVADLAEVAAAARAVIPPLLTLFQLPGQQSPSPGPGPANNGGSASSPSPSLAALQQEVLGGASRTWTFLQQKGGTGSLPSPPPATAACHPAVGEAVQALRRLASLPELGGLLLAQGKTASLSATVSAVLDGLVDSLESTAKAAYPAASGLTEVHLLNCTVALTTQLQRTEGTAQLAAAWLADRKDLAARYAERYVSVAWQPALRALSSDSSQQLRGAAALPDAQRAAVKTVWTAVNAALDTFTSHPGIVESIVWQKRVREQVGAAFLPAYRAFFTKYEGVPFTKGRRSKYERYSLAEAEAAVQGMLSGAARAPLEGSPQRSGASMSNRLARFRSKLMD
ncbi:hypothetical protein ACKKBG_A18215 [Auxenochlorella protothecoides x Auxenochlorella symbiontica]